MAILDERCRRSTKQKQQAQDDQVMATNNSSIVSKRSVERIYYPNEPQFFRFFVKKFQRRAPLINRGYHLRLHVIDVAVRRFLERPCSKTKVVVNLGCGSDVLPWQCMARYPDSCRGVKFVDVDFPDLIMKKSIIVSQTSELISPLTGLKTSTVSPIAMQADQYIQIGCDLRDLKTLEQALSTFLDIPNCVFMFVAEVSITYMETEGADGVIKWASALGQCRSSPILILILAEFCLLEQILPDGPDHPFAKTMLQHFEKLKTPLKSVNKYPTLQSQHDRFSSLGWKQVGVESLWQVWSHDKWLSAASRKELDRIEPFDEWEEFALFASHYCVVIAKSLPDDDVGLASTIITPPRIEAPVLYPEVVLGRDTGVRGQRRFGAAMKLKTPLGDHILSNTFGLGTNNRLRSVDLYSRDARVQDLKINMTGPSSRVCHGIADLGCFGSLLVGGRTSPTAALRDCWHFSNESHLWSRVDDLPIPLYRHSLTQLGCSNMALLVGGKSDTFNVFDGCLVYQPGSGWTKCEVSGLYYQPVFGAMLVSFKEVFRDPQCEDSMEQGVSFRGVLIGGLLQDGVVAKQVLRWNLQLPTNGIPKISFEPLLSSLSSNGEPNASNCKQFQSIISRFGGTALLYNERSIAIVGGIIDDTILSRTQEVLLLDVSDLDIKILATCCLTGQSEYSTQSRPLLVGTSATLAENGKLVIMGGGATCFSMGTYWNEGCYSSSQDFVSLLNKGEDINSIQLDSWRRHQTLEITDMPLPPLASQPKGKAQSARKMDIPRVRVDSPAAFAELLKTGKPMVIAGSKLGNCTQTWTDEYLVNCIGSDKEVVVHEAKTSNMDFNAKNFSYVTKKFGSFMSEVVKGGKLYLRALSENQPADQPADLKADFPRLADDFQLPDELSFVTENAFSSVLRISGPVNMWLHYDVMANVYCQIVGHKRMILFPPSDIIHLPFAPGASSSSIDIFSEEDPAFLAPTHPHEAVLKPGDILLLPPAWLHTAKPLTDLGVAVNVFFRNLEHGYSTGRDVYGNRDIAAYEKGRQDITRIAASFNKIPPDMREFYIRRLADELAGKAME
ncbi:leucine carboxyl methyltransferase [Biscogniauxia mediterranea]|nr:leucine carboxyl methyltransferase [Biscogniauxia mediterranea]